MWSDKGADPWVVEVLRWGYRIPFRRAPTLSKEPIPYPAYSPDSIRGKALEGEVRSLLEKGAIELAPLPSPGYYSQLVVVMKASGSWRQVFDLSLLNLKIQKTSFKMETLQSVLLSVRAGDWMESLDLKDAYLQVLMHPESRKFLRFVACGKIYQFKVLCFGLSTAPQVFTRVMAPVSAFLHRSGIRLRRYLDDWLIQASSQEQVLLALESVLQLCRSLGIVVNWEKSQLIPSQCMVYPGVLLDSISLRASPALKRVEKLLSIGDEFLSCERQPVSSWLELLGVLASLIQLVPGRRLRMRSLSVSSQAVLGSDRPVDSRSVDSGDPWRSGVVARSRSLGARYFARPSVPSARLMVRRLGRGLGSSFGRERYFRPLVSRRTGTVHQRQGALGRRKSSVVLRSADPGLLCRRVCGQFHHDNLSPQSGGNKISAAECHSSANSALGGVASCGSSSTVNHGSTQRAGGFSVSSQPDLGFRMDPQDRGISGPEEEVAGVHRPLCHFTQSPMLSIFFTIPRSERLGYGCSAPELEWVAGVYLSSLVTRSGSPQEAPVVLWSSPDTRSSVLASTALVPGSAGSGGGRSGGSASVSGPSLSAPLSSASSGGVRAVTSCLETIQQFAQAKGFSKHVAKQSALARRSSSRAGYQARWSIYRQWCHGKGHSVSRPSLHKIADFLFWLRRSKKLSISAVLGYRSMLSAVFRTVLSEISTSPVIHDLLRCFKVEAPCRAIRPPTWDLLKVLTYLRSSVFEPLSNASLRDLTRKTLFLVALATTKRVGELQALSRFVSFSFSVAGVSYVPEFLAKTETEVRSLPLSFSVQSLGDFAVGLPEDLLLCPVRSLRECVTRTSRFVNRPRRLFVSPRCPSRAMSKNAISYFLREVIVHSGSSSESVATPKVHSIRGIATSSAFFKNWSLSSVLEAAS